MARVIDTSSSKTGDGQTRDTIKYSDGSTRDITYLKEGGLTVTDTDYKGNQQSGDGVAGPLGGVTRINTW